MIAVAQQQAICIKRKKQIINEEQYLFYLEQLTVYQKQKTIHYRDVEDMLFSTKV